MYAEEFLVYCASGGSVGLLTWSLYSAYHEVLKHSEMDPERRIWIRSVLFRILIPFAQPIAGMLGAYGERLARREMTSHQKSTFLAVRKRLRRTLIAAGSPEGVTPDEFVGLTIVTGLIGCGIGLAMYALLRWHGHAALGTGVCMLLVLIGLAFPLLWLRDKLKARRLTLTRALPYSLDLLTLCVESGVDFTAAIARIIQKLGDQPLSYEFAELLRQIRMGRTRSDALRDLSERVDLPEMTSVVSSLIQADELGASLGPVLRIQADQLRVRRSQRAEKLASEAPVKMLFPLVCFIFPTLFIMIGGVIFLKMYYKAL